MTVEFRSIEALPSCNRHEYYCPRDGGNRPSPRDKAVLDEISIVLTKGVRHADRAGFVLKNQHEQNGAEEVIYPSVIPTLNSGKDIVRSIFVRSTAYADRKQAPWVRYTTRHGLLAFSQE